MFVRTNRDGIGKIISLSIGEEDECCFIELSKRRTGIKEYNIVKASHNIIDLIEDGDYVNGYLVEDITSVYDNGEEIITLHIASGSNYFQSNINDKKEIKSIVTKEQFESMSYKVGD